VTQRVPRAASSRDVRSPERHRREYAADQEKAVHRPPRTPRSPRRVPVGCEPGSELPRFEARGNGSFRERAARRLRDGMQTHAVRCDSDTSLNEVGRRKSPRAHRASVVMSPAYHPRPVTRRDQARRQVLYRFSLDEIPQVASENGSVWLDTSIIVEPVPAVIGQRGAS
jgi:hypothetical protein